MTAPASRAIRLIDALMAEQDAGRLAYEGSGGGRYRAEVRGRRRVYDIDRMTAWLDGYELGRDEGRPTGAAPRSAAPPAALAVLIGANALDTRRLQVLTALQMRGLGIAAAAQLIGRRRESARHALRFGRPLLREVQTPSLVVLEDALAPELDALYGAGAWREPPVPLYEGEVGAGQTRPEPVEWRRARALLSAHVRGYCEWLAPLDPDQVRRARAYQVARAFAGTRHELRISAPLAVPWLQGLADGTGDDELAELLTDRRNALHHMD